MQNCNNAKNTIAFLHNLQLVNYALLAKMQNCKKCKITTMQNLQIDKIAQNAI
jgi:hypothetical protein